MEFLQLQTDEGEKIQAIIHCFCLDSRNRLWVGTSNGLIQVDPKNMNVGVLNCLRGLKVCLPLLKIKRGMFGLVQIKD